MTRLIRSKPSPYVRLIVFTYQGDKHAIVSCQRATAEYFGWLKHYETYEDLIRRKAQENGGRTTPVALAAAGRDPSGTQIRICRAASKNTYAPKRAHSLRVNSRVTNADLAELAAFAEGEWYWMEARNGARIDRDEWLRIYTGDAKIPRTTRTRAA